MFRGSNPQGRIWYWRMLAPAGPEPAAPSPSGVTQAWRGRNHRKREKEFPKPGETGMPLDALHPRARQPTCSGDYTSVAVNWTERTWRSPTNVAHPTEMPPASRPASTVAASTVWPYRMGTMLDMPQPSERERREYLRLPQARPTRHDQQPVRGNREIPVETTQTPH